MSSVRLRRLAADWERVKNEFAGHPFIKVEPMEGNPPEKYIVTYRVRGLVPGPAGRPEISEYHQAEIYLHQNYPRDKPYCVMRTPHFNPNIGRWICIGDHWAAGETLVHVIVQIGDIIQYKNINPQSALNVEAARWAVQNRHRLPIGHVDLYAPEPDIHLSSPRDVDITLGRPVASGEGKQDDDSIQIVLS